MGSSFRKPITVVRQNTEGSFINGRWVVADESPETRTTFTILGSVQSPTPEEMHTLPEGRRTTDTLIIYSDTALMTASIPLKRNSDIILYKDNEYTVHAISEWHNKCIEHYKYIMTKAHQ